jgi:hypothetical protein
MKEKFYDAALRVINKHNFLCAIPLKNVIYFNTFGISMDVQFWIWLIVIVVTLIARATKKKPKDSGNAGNPRPAQPDFNTKPMTFEELLREIQTSKTPSLPPVSKKPQYQDYDDDIQNEEKQLEKTDYNYRNEDSIYETYEKAKRDAFVKPSLEDTVKLQDTIVRFGQFKGYQTVESRDQGAEILKNFHDPEGFKRAFIMSEILKRKF